MVGTHLLVPRGVWGLTEKPSEFSVDGSFAFSAGAAAPLCCSSQPVLAVEGTRGSVLDSARTSCGPRGGLYCRTRTLWLLQLVWFLVIGMAFLRLLDGWLLRLALSFHGVFVLLLPHPLDLDGVHCALRGERRSLRLREVLFYRVLRVLNSISRHRDASSHATPTLPLWMLLLRLCLVLLHCLSPFAVSVVVHVWYLHAVHLVVVHLQVVSGHGVGRARSMHVTLW